MTNSMIEKFYQRMPEVVAEMAAWETGEDKWLQTGYHFTKWNPEGEFYEKDALDDIGLKDVLRKARRVGATVRVSEDGNSIEIRRDLHDGEYFLATIFCVPSERKTA